MKTSADSARPNISQRRKARSLLVQALYQWQISEASVADIEAQFLDNNKGKIDWSFFHEVLTGICSNKAQIDAVFSPFLDRTLKDLSPVELAILRIGGFELSKRLDIPYRVVINEGVELARKFGATDSHKYINGVLDKAARVLRPVELNAQT